MKDWNHLQSCFYFIKILNEPNANNLLSYFVCISHFFQTLLDFCAKEFLWGILRFHFIIITFQHHRCFVGFYLPVKSLPQHNVGLRGWVGTKGSVLYNFWNVIVIILALVWLTDLKVNQTSTNA